MDLAVQFWEESPAWGSSPKKLHRLAAECRLKRGLSQMKLADKIGYGQPYLALLEGGRRPFNQVSIVAYAQALGAPEILERFCQECPVHQAKKEKDAQEGRSTK